MRPIPKREARLRHGRHYLMIIQQARQIFKAGDELTALTTFDNERRQIDITWNWALCQSPSAETDALVIGFAGATATIGDLRYNIQQERIPQCEAQIAAAQRLRDSSAECQGLNSLGVAYRNLGNPQKAITYHERQLMIARATGDQLYEAMGLGNLDNSYLMLGNVTRAMELHQHQLSITRVIRNRKQEGGALSNLGGDHYAWGIYDVQPTSTSNT